MGVSSLHYFGFQASCHSILNKITVFWDITPCSPVEVHDYSEEYTASIFRRKEYARQEIIKKQGRSITVLLSGSSWLTF
jgi:hypothetical protein